MVSLVGSRELLGAINNFRKRRLNLEDVVVSQRISVGAGAARAVKVEDVKTESRDLETGMSKLEYSNSRRSAVVRRKIR